jgi:hypothetical protein
MQSTQGYSLSQVDGLEHTLPRGFVSPSASCVVIGPFSNECVRMTGILAFVEPLVSSAPLCLSVFLSPGVAPSQSGGSAIRNTIATLIKTISQASSNQSCPVLAVQGTHLRRVFMPRTSPGAFSRPPASCTTTGRLRTCPGPSVWRWASGKVTSSARSTTP